MAKPILRTPELSGADAERFIKLNNEVLSEKDKDILKACVETYRRNKKQLAQY
jgi:hypothetical protein